MSPTQAHAQGFVVTLFKGQVTTVPDVQYLRKGTLHLCWRHESFYFVGLFLADASVTIESYMILNWTMQSVNILFPKLEENSGAAELWCIPAPLHLV